MAFKEVSNLDAETTIALGGINKKTGKENPTSITGYFIGTRDVETDFGPAKLHVFQTDRGNVGVWGKTDLNRKLTSVTPGVMVRATQNGQVKVPGRNPMYKYKVEVDTDDSIEVAMSSVVAEDYAEENDETFGAIDNSYEETEIDAEEETFDEPVVVRPVAAKKAATAPDAARQAKVKALLNKSKSVNS